MSGLADDALEAPCPLHERFMESGSRAKSLGREMACDAVEMLFGLQGIGVPGIMKKR